MQTTKARAKWLKGGNNPMWEISHRDTGLKVWSARPHDAGAMLIERCVLPSQIDVAQTQKGRSAAAQQEYRCFVPNCMCNGIGGAMTHHVSRGISQPMVLGYDLAAGHTHCNHIFEAVPIGAGIGWSEAIAQCKWCGYRPNGI